MRALRRLRNDVIVETAVDLTRFLGTMFGQDRATIPFGNVCTDVTNYTWLMRERANIVDR